jgi:uncharacterized protein with HEPN domain
MSRKIKEIFLLDIIVAIEKIRFIVNKFDNSEDLKYDFLHWDAIIREFEVIGEAMNYCLKNDIFKDDVNKRKVIDLRNILIHKYFGIDEEAIFDIAKNNLDWLEYLVVKKFLELEKSKRDELLNFLIEENKHLSFVVKKLNELKNAN